MTPVLFVCTNRRMGAGSCAARSALALCDELRRVIAERGLGWAVEASACMGHCALGPNLKAAPGGPLLHGCKPEQAEELIDRLQAEWNPD
jgi:(2Fe-2S) ferredoxin